MKLIFLAVLLFNAHANALTEKECFEFASELGNNLNQLNGWSPIERTAVSGKVADDEFAAYLGKPATTSKIQKDTLGIERYTEIQYPLNSMDAEWKSNSEGTIYLSAKLVRVCTRSVILSESSTCGTMCYRVERQDRDN